MSRISNGGEIFNQIITRLEDEQKRKVDAVTTLNSLKVNPDFTFESYDLGKVKMTDHAFGQLCSQVYDYPLPVDYFKKLFEDNPQRFSEQLNFHLQNGKGLSRKFRMVKGKENGDPTMIRGIVSEKYIPYDDLDVLSIFVDASKHLPEFEVMNNFSNDNMMFLRIGFPSTSRSFGTTIDGKDDKNFLALDLLNSEVGTTSIIANPSIFRLVCTNGMVQKTADYGLFKQRHIHINPVAVNEGLRHSIILGVNEGNEMLENFEQSRKIKIDNPYEVLDRYGKSARMSNKMIESLKDNFEIEREKSLFAVVNAFTRTATQINNIERRLELEKYASKVLEDGLKGKVS